MLFYSDITQGIKKNYSELIKELNSLDSYSLYCYTNDYYSVFKHIIHSLLLGEEIILLDSDFSSKEIEELVENRIEFIFSEKKIHNPLNISSFEHLLKQVYQNSINWRMTLFTSGTTGIPKKISHSFETITRFVQKGEKHTSDVWGFAYNPTHMAGIQVFFQAFFNQNFLVRLFGLPKHEILTLVAQTGITHISATPTFYRLLLPSAQAFPIVKRITFGGEKFDSHTATQLSNMFPNAYITNVYASTEAGTLFASTEDKFLIKPEMEHLIKIQEGVLLLHKSLIGISAFSHTAEEWYNTGDIIEVISLKPLIFKFVSRQNEVINVGGYKVNPTEVEDAIREINGVQDAVVFGKKNNLVGNIVCCEVISNNSNLSEQKIREYLTKRLQEFKIPRIIKFVEYIETTRTGKILRKT